jgi:hypothetical protein
LTADWLSEEWAEQASGFATLLPGLGSGEGSGMVVLAVGGGPRKEARVRWRYEDGTPAFATGDAEADLALTMVADDAAAVLSGQVSPSVAYMRGRLKASGDGALLLAFLRSTTDGQFAEWRRRVADLAPETATGGSRG